MAQAPLTTFGRDVLLVFVGHSRDAAAEATALLDIEGDLNRVLQHHLKVNSSLPFKTVRLWEWNRDAPAGVGGQEQVISPIVDRANAAVFVFKERIGEVTWAELERLRNRVPSVAVLPFFPATPPDGMRLMDQEVVASWAELLRKKKELTADWNAPESRSVTPMDDYRDADHLKELARAELEEIVAALLRARPAETPPAPAPAPGKFLGDHEHLNYDRRPVLAHGWEELDQELVQRFLEQPLSEEPFTGARSRATVAERLLELGLLADGRPTLGALLCFAPPRLLVNLSDACGMQLVIYSGTDRASSRPSITPLRGNLLTLYEKGMQWLTAQAGLRRRGRVGTAERDELEIPRIVLHEVLANALVHRDYETPALRDQPTRVEVYADRVEVTSFGGLPQAVPLDSLNREPERVVPFRRNPVIARVFQHMMHAELNATGVPRMRAEMERIGLPPPRFTQNLHDSIVRVVLLRPSEWADAPAPPAPAHEPARGGRPSVFISSTVQDLAEHRQSVADACHRLAFVPIMLEGLAGTSENEVSAALRYVDQADVYVGIFAHRYGYVPHGQELSLSELEYNRAVERGIPRLLFLMHEDHPVRPRDVETGPGAERLARLKERMARDQVVGYFRSPEDLRNLVMQSLVEVRDRLPKPDVEQPASRGAATAGTLLPVPPEPYLPHPYMHGGELVGRESEVQLLNEWVAGSGGVSEARVFCIVGLGGMGKSALAWHWFNQIAPGGMQPLAGRMWWSFYEPGSFADFVTHALAYVSRQTVEDVRRLPAAQRERQLLSALDREPWLLVLDGVERLLAAYSPREVDAGGGGTPGLRHATNPRVGAFLRRLTTIRSARILITTRLFPADLQTRAGTPVPSIHALFLGGLAEGDAVRLWKALGVRGPEATLTFLSRQVDNHPLTLQLLASQVAHYRRAPGDVERWLRDHPSFKMETVAAELTKGYILQFALRGLDEQGRAVLNALAGQHRPAGYEALAQSLVGPGRVLNSYSELNHILTDLEDRSLIRWDRATNSYDIHPVVRAAILHASG